MSKILQTKVYSDHEVQLVELGDGWGDWKYQINYYVLDGKNYGRPGKRTCRSQINYLTETEAVGWYKNMTGTW